MSWVPQVIRTSHQFDEVRDFSGSLKLDFRQVCAANSLDVFGGDEVDAKILKLVTLGYYTRKAIKGKPLKLLDGMGDAAKFLYFMKDDKTVSTSGSGSSSKYVFEQNLAEVPEEQALGE
jgi:hypothetical protein